MARIYGYYCPVAHALGVVGDRWSLLIVRDLLRKPLRFTDLLGNLTDITPKWLMLRLRKLEETGVVEREQRQDRREVWYKLTPAGYDLRSVVESLWAWGLHYAMRPPLPGEVVRPEMAMGTLAASLNKRTRKLPRPATWLFQFIPGGSYNLCYDGQLWSVSAGETKNPAIIITTSPEWWATFLAVERKERAKMVKTLQVSGVSERVNEFLQTLGISSETAQAH